jgi:pyruvate kinase
MLSGESAMGDYPVESVAMLAKIAAAIEPHRPVYTTRQVLKKNRKDDEIKIQDLIASSVENTLDRITPAVVIVPTHSGASARSITRFKLPVWITGISSQKKTIQDLMFSYGVWPVNEPDHPEDWKLWTKKWLQYNEIKEDLVVLTEGPSARHPERNNRMEIIDLRQE